MAICEVVKYEGDSGTLIFKFPEEDFNTFSQLIVHESQEAVLFKDGRMCDVFGPGRYTLHTGNIPLLNKLVNLSTGGVSPFHCEVYFINRSLALDYNWGTSSQALVMDQTYQLLLHIGASGVIGIRIRDPRQLLLKIVGTDSALTASQCLRYFRENVSMQVKQYIAEVMKEPGMNFIALDQHLMEFSAAVKDRLTQDFADVGIEIYNFLVSAVKIPPEEYDVITAGQRQMQQEQYDLRTAQFSKQRRMIEAEGEAAYRQIQGYDWRAEQQAKAMQSFAANPGAAANPASIIAQAPTALMFGSLLANDLGAAVKGNCAADDAPKAEGAFCAQCGAALMPGAKFCTGCGAPVVQTPGVCPSCGAALSPGMKFCPQCGAKL